MTRPTTPRTDVSHLPQRRREGAALEPAAGGAAVVKRLPFVRDDAALVAGLRAAEPWARAALFDRFAPQVERVLQRILGRDLHTDIEDLLHDTFVQALASLDRLRDPAAMLGWMQSIAAHTAYRAIRARRARRWLRFLEPSELPDIHVDGVAPEHVEAYRRTYALLERMPAAERIAFALRHVDGMELGRLAEINDCSLATIKRRLAKAERRFARAAERDEVLRPWVVEGGRWNR